MYPAAQTRPIAVLNVRDASGPRRLREAEVDVHGRQCELPLSKPDCSVFTQRGFLASHGPDALDIYRRLGGYAAKILSGANPSDLPVEQPIKFTLMINLKTGKVLGITIPPTLLARADEVIE